MALRNVRLDLVVADVYSTGLYWPGGRGALFAEATWSGGSLKLQLQPALTQTWFDTPASTSLSANGGVLFELPAGMIKIVKTGSPTAVYATVNTTSQVA